MKVLLILLLTTSLFSSTLYLYDKKVTATTSSVITDVMNPMSQNMSSVLTMKNKDPLTLSGSFTVEMNSFMSDQLERDEAMKETLNVEDFKTATFTITNMEKFNDDYLVTGIMLFHGIEREMEVHANITIEEKTLNLTATSMMFMSKHGVKMPCLIFVCVEDKVDILVEASYTID